MTDREHIEDTGVGIVIGMALILLVLLLLSISGCAPLPPPAPAVVESVTIQPSWATLDEGECLRIGQLYGVDRDGQPIRCRPHQEIARDQAQQANEVIPWWKWLLLSSPLIGSIWLVSKFVLFILADAHHDRS